MESRADRYRRLATDDQLRALRTNDPSQKRAFEEAAREWLTLADDVERMEMLKARFGCYRQTRRITQVSILPVDVFRFRSNAGRRLGATAA